VQEVTADGEIKFIHAATSKGVMISSLNDSYWGPKYRFAKRVLK
jgi:lipoprotein Spr